MAKKILVIDDDEAIRKSFSLALEDTGYEVTAVESGAKGVEAVKAGKYDLIYLDLKMPGMDGVATLREIRKIDTNIPVYIITAFHKEFFAGLQKVTQDGIRFELLEKPISGSKIASITKGVLESTITY